jgi:hypothetical protein
MITGMEMPIMTPEATLQEMLRKAQRREGTPVRRAFVQAGTRRSPKPGPLASFITSRDRTALDLYLLAVTLATKEPYRVIYAAGWWARALRVSHETVISRAWNRLQDRGLISRHREGRVQVVTVKNDDGKRGVYEHPARAPVAEPYGKLPLAYWQDEYFNSLDLAAKAMLLIALCQVGQFTLPFERAKEWYGISADTCERGLRTLREKKILTRQSDWHMSRYAPGGYAKTYVYWLQGAFAKRGKEVRLKVVS